MGRNRGKKNSKQAEGGDAQPTALQQPQQPDYVQPVDPPRAVLAVHPERGLLAVAVGPELRVFDTRTGECRTLVTKPEQPQPSAQQPAHAARAPVPYVRGVAFDPAGRFLLAGGEDKAAGLRLWDTTSWELLQTIKVPKKVTNTAFTADGRHMLAADKFGDVLAAATERPAGLAEGQEQEPEIMLGHYCAILTSLSLSAGGRLVATTDRDNRVRVSIVPAEPLQGAHEIQSLCFGHTAFVTCSAFVQSQGQELLVTGSGDGTMRLWDPMAGALLHTLELPQPPQPGSAANGGEQQQQEQPEDGQQEEAVQSDQGQVAEDAEGAEAAEAAEAVAGAAGGEQEAAEGCSQGAAEPSDAPVPLALAAAPDGSYVVAAVDGRDELCLLRVDWSARQLAEVGWFALPDLHLPACLAFEAGGRLWVAGGPVADDSTAAYLACGTISDAALAPAPLPEWLPAAGAAALEAKAGNEAELLAAAAEQRRLASQMLRKRKYSLAQLEGRKRLRRDRMAASAAAAKQAASAGGKRGQAV